MSNKPKDTRKITKLGPLSNAIAKFASETRGNPLTPVRYNEQFYAIGTKAEDIRSVKFFQGYNLANHQMKPRFLPLDLSGCGQIIVYLSRKEAVETFDSLMKADPSLNLDIISL